MAIKKTKSSSKTKAKTKKIGKPKTIVKKKSSVKAGSAAKPKAKAKSLKKVVAKKKVISKAAVKKTVGRKSTAKPKAEKKMVAKEKSTLKTVSKPKKKVDVEKSTQVSDTQQFPTLKPNIPSFRKPSTQLVERRRPIKPRPVRTNHFSFMKAPGMAHEFDVGDNVEVFCDHDKSKERVRGWLKGIVVQVDNKMVAVQFRTNVYLTDGWMVPDRILWYPLTSEHIRSLPGKKKAAKKEFLPDF